MGLVKDLVEGLSESSMWPHRDTFAQYDHGLMQEHMPLMEGHSRFYKGGPQSMYPDAHGYGDYRDYRNGIFRHAECFADHDCAEGHTCEVTDSYNHMSACLPVIDYHVANAGGWHERIHGDEPKEQKKHTERGHFEIGYWCLKNTDCESKHCA